MPFLPSIGKEDKVPHVLAKFQNGTQMPLLEFHEALLRGDSPFSVKERELMAADADAVLSAGWSEQALYDAVQICCLYNFMNRFVEGLGLTPIPEQFEFEGQMIKQGGYAGMAGDFGIR